MKPEFTFERDGNVVISKLKYNGNTQKLPDDPFVEYRRMLEESKAQHARILEESEGYQAGT